MAYGSINVPGLDIFDLLEAGEKAIPESSDFLLGVEGEELIRVPADAVGGGGKRTCTFVIGTSTAGWTEKDCDFLCDGVNDEYEIQNAIGQATNYRVQILMLEGLYNISSPIIFDKPSMTLTGSKNTILRNMTDNEEGCLIRVQSENITISNLKMSGELKSYSSDQNRAIRLESGCKNIEIKNNTFSGLSYCVYNDSKVSGITGINIESNVFDGCWYVSFLYSVKFVRICNNTNPLAQSPKCVSGASIVFYKSSHVSVKGNLFESFHQFICSMGDLESPVSHILLANNLMIGNQYGSAFLAGSYMSVIGNIIHCAGLNTIGSVLTIGEGYNSANPGVYNLVQGNTIYYKSGKSADYGSTQYPVKICKNNTNSLISENLTPGKNYLNEAGSGCTFINNKY